MTKRHSGILLHITSLPSKYGIGDMGSFAYAFVDFVEFLRTKILADLADQSHRWY